MTLFENCQNFTNFSECFCEFKFGKLNTNPWSFQKINVCLFFPGDIEDCIVTPCMQGQFTPLPEALCDVILELTTAGTDAGLESMRKSLSERFPNIQTPSHETVYDTLAQLIAERKIYHTSKGYFIVTPE